MAFCGLTYYTSYMEEAVKMQIVMNLHRQLVLFITDAVTDCVPAGGNADFHIISIMYWGYDTGIYWFSLMLVSNT